jgi:hypothetical protein
LIPQEARPFDLSVPIDEKDGRIKVLVEEGKAEFVPETIKVRLLTSEKVIIFLDAKEDYNVNQRFAGMQFYYRAGF